MKKLIASFIVASVGIYLAVLFVPDFFIEGSTKQIIITTISAGLILAIISRFLKPIINLITIPIRLLTFGFFGLILNMAFIWGIDVAFPSLYIVGLWPLFWSSFLIWGLLISVNKV